MEYLSIRLKLAELHKYLAVGVPNQQQRQKETKIKIKKERRKGIQRFTFMHTLSVFKLRSIKLMVSHAKY
jgi:hypothetical protein